ncbi:hypothetical protein [Burkholderia multivorans]|uniref:hypothetical protein n=2 Tax=Burkholderia multivorans TaxID=87883 RepID=UPI001562AF1D|nr:hypothetical protein [Burkholderia multivorans]MBU9121193.1 hypothetical protein [Burkholderia multivorans]MBU9555542.1 hypothetical protein [Burkholderia multivorans]MBU9606629.1 hypothetical protein [Burkholderia multivorans]MBU9623410.1 hypothetical protein [Burkholderia multivorans]MCA8439288.1 hypothetical protein [Burkholderia multivorans]
MTHDRKAIGMTQRQKTATFERRIGQHNAMSRMSTADCSIRSATSNIQISSRFKDTREYRFSNKPRQATGMRNAREIARRRIAQTYAPRPQTAQPAHSAPDCCIGISNASFAAQTAGRPAPDNPRG